MLTGTPAPSPSGTIYIPLPAPALHTKDRVSCCWEKASHRQISLWLQICLRDTDSQMQKGRRVGTWDQAAMEDPSEEAWGALGYVAGDKAMYGIALSLGPCHFF